MRGAQQLDQLVADRDGSCADAFAVDGLHDADWSADNFRRFRIHAETFEAIADEGTGGKHVAKLLAVIVGRQRSDAANSQTGLGTAQLRHRPGTVASSVALLISALKGQKEEPELENRRSCSGP